MKAVGSIEISSNSHDHFTFSKKFPLSIKTKCPNNSKGTFAFQKLSIWSQLVFLSRPDQADWNLERKLLVVGNHLPTLLYSPQRNLFWEIFSLDGYLADKMKLGFFVSEHTLVPGLSVGAEQLVTSR